MSDSDNEALNAHHASRASAINEAEGTFTEATVENPGELECAKKEIERICESKAVTEQGCKLYYKMMPSGWYPTNPVDSNADKSVYSAPIGYIELVCRAIANEQEETVHLLNTARAPASSSAAHVIIASPCSPRPNENVSGGTRAYSLFPPASRPATRSAACSIPAARERARADFDAAREGRVPAEVDVRLDDGHEPRLLRDSDLAHERGVEREGGCGQGKRGTPLHNEMISVRGGNSLRRTSEDGFGKAKRGISRTLLQLVLFALELEEHVRSGTKRRDERGVLDVPFFALEKGPLEGEPMAVDAHPALVVSCNLMTIKFYDSDSACYLAILYSVYSGPSVFQLPSVRKYRTVNAKKISRKIAECPSHFADLSFDREPNRNEGSAKTTPRFQCTPAEHTKGAQVWRTAKHACAPPPVASSEESPAHRGSDQHVATRSPPQHVRCRSRGNGDPATTPHRRIAHFPQSGRPAGAPSIRAFFAAWSCVLKDCPKHPNLKEGARTPRKRLQESADMRSTDGAWSQEFGTVRRWDELTFRITMQDVYVEQR
ncbi:hypothetical protein DFH11DRAFT_1544797 [Phellopilus nigrolimitatus]|nr:hypothetical protein DFH11DRAFT_1544797 [Phellopilus nigrolimitatus]